MVRARNRTRPRGAGVVVLGIALAASLLPGGCGDDEEGGSGNRPNPLAVIAAASDVSVLSVLGLQAGTLGPLAFPPGSAPAPGFAPADSFFPPPLLCPLVTVTRDSLGDSMAFDFGDGCVSTMDGRFTEGRVTFDVTANSLGNGLRFTAADLGGFSRDGRTVLGGDLFVEERGQLLDIDASLVSFAQGSLDAILSATFTAGPDGDGPGSPYYCRTWTIGAGSGTITVGGLDYGIAVLDTLVVSTCCAYPVRGTVSVTGDGRTPAFLDFGNGTCDSLAVLTIGGQTQAVVLGY
jgi:hypothetical protein